MAGENSTEDASGALIDRLERQARWLTVAAAIQGAVSGAVLGYLVGPYFRRPAWQRGRGQTEPGADIYPYTP